MSQTPSRRHALRLAAGAAAAAPFGYALPQAHAAEATATAPAVPASWAVRPFPLDQVSLGEGCSAASAI